MKILEKYTSMCLNPIKLSNPKKDVDLSGGQLFQMEVPCGECAECKERMKNDWYFRCYYESKSTFDEGGYVYFDTLTYADDYLPHINDFLPEEYMVSDGRNFPCFNTGHYRSFLVRLRRALSYRGYDVSGNLRYFLTSEYGDDERYTHRPHYHVLFFVKRGFIDPFVLSQIVDECWQYGRTDGVPYKPYSYVRDHVFGYKFNCDTVHMQMVCNYVAKYITKDSDFIRTVRERLDDIFHRLFGYDFELDLSGRGRELYSELKRQCLQFCRCSKGFGESFLQYNDYNEVIKTGMISMPDSDNIVKHTPLPVYYQRKLFYDMIKDCDGVYHWELNDLGKEYKYNRAVDSVERLAVRFNDWQWNMMNYNYYHDSSDSSWYDDILSAFGELNRGRDLSQFAEYLVFYRGRIKTPAQIERESRGIFVVDDRETFYKSAFRKDGERLYYYGTPTDYHVYGSKFFSRSKLGNVSQWKNDGTLDKINRHAKVFRSVKSLEGVMSDIVDVRTFRKRYVINDSCDERFRDYDKMWSLYCEAQLEKNDTKQSSYDARVALKKRMKGILNKSL